MGLPYMLGDKDPKDPVNGWEKTWAYLKELNSCIEYYPTGTGIVMKELGEGTRDMTITVSGWDINPRALGVVPKEYKVVAFDNLTWVNDTQYLMVPKGVTGEKLAVVLDLMKFLLEPTQQAMTYDKGYFYPGPAVKNVPVTMAPKESQDVLKEFGRAEYDGWIAKFPHTQPLDSKRWSMRSASGTSRSARRRRSEHARRSHVARQAYARCRVAWSTTCPERAIQGTAARPRLAALRQSERRARRGAA